MRDRQMDKAAHPVPHKGADVFQAPGGKSTDGQGVVGAVGQILQRVEQSTVQIKDYSIISGHCEGASFEDKILPHFSISVPV